MLLIFSALCLITLIFPSEYLLHFLQEKNPSYFFQGDIHPDKNKRVLMSMSENNGMKNTTAVVGLDFSLRSPGVCVRTPGGRMHLIGFYGSEDTTVELGDTTVHLFQRKDGGGVETEEEPHRRVEQDLARYAHLTERLLKLLCSIFPDISARAQVHMVIESYAFYGRGHTGNNYKLHEVTGCFKLRLFMAGFTWWSERPVSVWRRICFGTPKAQKKDAFDFFCTQMPGVDLMSICKRKLGKNDTVPCPVQDICEAFCIMWSSSSPSSAGGKQKKKRRRRTEVEEKDRSKKNKTKR